MLGLGTSITSIDSAQIYKEADEFADAAELDVWFDFGLLTGAQDSEVTAVTNLGIGGSTYNIDANVDVPTLDYVLMHRPSVKFDGSSNEALELASAYSTTGKPYTWFIVLYRAEDSNDVIISNALDGAEYFSLRGNGSSIRVAMADMSSDRTIAFNSTGGGTVNYTYQDASDADSNGIQIIVYNRNSSGVVKVYNHLGQFITTNSNAHLKAAADMTVGAIGGTSSGSLADFNGNIGEFGMFDADIDIVNCVELAKNLAIKWGAAIV